MNNKTLIMFTKGEDLYEIKGPETLDLEMLFSLDLLDSSKTINQNKERYHKRLNVYDKTENNLNDIVVFKNELMIGEDGFGYTFSGYRRYEIDFLDMTSEMYINGIHTTSDHDKIAFVKVDEGLLKVKSAADRINNERKQEMIDNKALSLEEKNALKERLDNVNPYYFSVRNNEIYDLDFLSDDCIGYAYFEDAIMFDSDDKRFITDVPEFYEEAICQEVCEEHKIYMFNQCAVTSCIKKDINEYMAETVCDKEVE